MTPTGRTSVLDGQLQERDDETDAVHSLQQAVVAAVSAEDASRRTWTRARPLMNEVDRNGPFYPTSVTVHSQVKAFAKVRAKERIVTRAQGLSLAEVKSKDSFQVQVNWLEKNEEPVLGFAF